MADSLLDPQFMRRLERLELQTRRILRGQTAGERKSKRKGVSIDFADYRHYVRGDDLRFVDWNLYARLDRLFIKIFHEEQDLECHILLDRSRSMDFGEPNKMDFARRVAAAISYIGLLSHDKFAITSFDDGAAESFGPSRGRHHVARMLKFLDGLAPSGETSLHEVCRAYAQKSGAKGIVIVVSDFLDESGYADALRYLIRDDLDVYLLHVLSPQEIDPTIGGHLELEDLETEHRIELTVNPRLKEIYKRNVEAYCTQIRDHATRYGMFYTLVSTERSLEELILKQLRRGGLFTG